MPGTFVYVSNAETKDILGLGLDPDKGLLVEIERTPVPGTDMPSPTSLPRAVSPDRRFLYATLRSPPYLASSFAIDPSSARLTHVAQAPLVGFRIDPGNGLLAPIGRWPTETMPRGFAIDPRGGTLSLSARHATGGMPNWVEIIDCP